jgi:hypothetical protein
MDDLPFRGFELYGRWARVIGHTNAESHDRYTHIDIAGAMHLIGPWSNPRFGCHTGAPSCRT